MKAAFNAEASRLTGQRGSRSSWRDSGMQEFEGHFSQLFQDNGRTQLSDLGEVATALKQVATELEDVEQAAWEENNQSLPRPEIPPLCRG